MAEQFTLQKGAPVPVAPGITVTLNGVNVPQTGATTALVTVTHMRQSKTVDGKIDALLLAVEALPAKIVTDQPGKVPSAKVDLSPIQGEIQALRTVVDALKSSMEANLDDSAINKASKKLEAAFDEFEGRFDQIDTALRLLVDE